MRVDVHTHIFPERLIRDQSILGEREPWFAQCHSKGELMASEADLYAYMNVAHLDVAVAMCWPFANSDLCREANDFILDVARRSAGRIIAGVVVNPRDEGAQTELRRCAAAGAQVVGELNADAQGWSEADPEQMERLCTPARAHDLVINVHCSEPVGRSYPGKGTMTPPRVLSFLEHAHGLRCVLAHGGGGLWQWGEMKLLGHLLDNVWFDTAALPYVWEPAALGTAIQGRGHERVVFGSDFPLLPFEKYRRWAHAASLDDPTRQLFFGGAAASLLRL